MQTHISNSSHQIVQTQSRLKCTMCLNSYSITEAACKQWLASPCSGGTVAPHANHIKINNQNGIHIGNRVIHVSHNLYKCRGLIYCLKCGAIGTNQVRLLAGVCEEPTITGLRTLKALQKGKLPDGLKAWPDDI